jgi:signal transduction histidine kinase
LNSASSPLVRRLSLRAALSATGVVGVAYLVVCVAIVSWLTLSLTAQVDERLERALRFEVAAANGVLREPGGEPPERPLPVEGEQPGRPDFPFGRERVTWTVDSEDVISSDRSDLELPAAYATVTSPTSISIGDGELRIAGAAVDDGHIVVGESMGAVNDARTTAVVGLALIAPLLLGAVFVGSLAIGRRVALPIERARQRQLTFTADASHELRTPLAVIEANTSLALQEDRDTVWYRAAFERVHIESQRMRRLIDDLLWLARFDAAASPPESGPVDLGVLVEGAADRFASVAEARSVELQVRVATGGVTLSAPAEWIDQLIGVLLDNACKYAPKGGHVRVSVEARERRAWLIVDDDGPGIAVDQRERILDRFHRGSDSVGGTGLGLAIGDAIVQASEGRWRIETSPLGGARVAVSWAAPEREGVSATDRR